mgnify:CR=1 FL=1
MTYDKQKIQEEFRKMKATGIVRRIDDLGRVVIPKEIRKTLRIKEGTPLEIFYRQGRTDHSEKIFAHWRAEYVCCGICGSIGADHRTDCLYYRS